MHQTRAALAEAIGTAMLAAAVIGAGQGAAGLGALAPVPVSAVVGLSLFTLITVFSRVSGGHINPAVSLLFLSRGDIGPSRAGAYVVAQLLGAVAGVLMVHAMFGLPVLQGGTIARSGASLWLSEGVATFCLILVIAGGMHVRPALVPALVGGISACGVWFTASGGMANPAVTLARALTATPGGILPGHVPMLVLSQLAGAAAAILVARGLFATDDPPVTD